MAADRIRTWREGESHFVHLSGHVAILQELDGLRAEEALVRIDSPPPGKQGIYLVEARGERAVPAGRPKDSPRAALSITLSSTAGVDIRPPHAGGPVIQLVQPPDGLAILGRFLAEYPAKVRSATSDPPPEAAVDAGVVGISRNPLIPERSPADEEPPATPLTGTPRPRPWTFRFWRLP